MTLVAARANDTTRMSGYDWTDNEQQEHACVSEQLSRTFKTGRGSRMDVKYNIKL